VRDQKDLVGIIVVAKDGPIKSTKDLDGKVIVFPSPNAFAASLYMRALLTEKEKINFTPKYVKTHQNVYRSVAASVAPAGGGVKSTLDDEETALQEKLTILYRTPGTPSHPICAQARISSQLMKSVEKAILKIGADPKNKQMMAKINIQSPVVADFNKDYAPLLHLGLEKYAETVKE
jgi:phosphonate transport system substrate-binding protein